jgi:hypothetical protein
LNAGQPDHGWLSSLSLHVLRRRHHDLGEVAVVAPGNETLLEIAQHRFGLVSEYIGEDDENVSTRRARSRTLTSWLVSTRITSAA